jgi:SAM-dependent methyltransferase
MKKAVSDIIVKLAGTFLVEEVYRGIFRRKADEGELASGAALVKSTGSITPLVKSLLASSEFKSRSFGAGAPKIVKAAYKAILGRAPDSGELEVDVARLARDGDITALLHAKLACPEFQRKNRAFIAAALSAMSSELTGSVDIETTPLQFQQLFTRVCDQWTKLGDTEPHWSVLTGDNFKSENFSQHEDEFYQGGRAMLSTIEKFFKRSGMEINRAATVLELGCGTGRITHALAEAFANVIAVDVSPGNMRLCREKLRQCGRSNVEYALLKSPADIQKLPPVDFFFSIIVLQHNPPPMIHYLLSEILGKIRESGAVLFQVPTHTPGYSFDVNEYLQSPEPVMEMHCLPMQAVFNLLAKHRLKPVEVLMDGWTGHLGSHTFFAVRA